MLPKENGGRRLKASTETLRLVRLGAPANHRRQRRDKPFECGMFAETGWYRGSSAFVPVWDGGFFYFMEEQE